MLDQLRNLTNPPGAFGNHETTLIGLTLVSVLLMFAGPALWAVVYLINQRESRATGGLQPTEFVNETDAESEQKSAKAA